MARPPAVARTARGRCSRSTEDQSGDHLWVRTFGTPNLWEPLTRFLRSGFEVSLVTEPQILWVWPNKVDIYLRAERDAFIADKNATRAPGNHRSDWTGTNPSLSVCMKLTTASSSASDRFSRPTRLVFMLAVDSGAGQHVVPSPAS
jgi:hypothetical protein